MSFETVWHIRGPLAGTFEQLPTAEANNLVSEGMAQIADGKTPLIYPENHPDVKAGKVQMPPRPAKKKRAYKRRDMTAENPE